MNRLTHEYKKQLQAFQGITSTEAAARAIGGAFSARAAEAASAIGTSASIRWNQAMQGDPLASVLEQTHYPELVEHSELARLRKIRRNLEGKIAAAKAAKADLEGQIAATKAELRVIEEKREDAKASLQSEYPLYSLVENVEWIVDQIEEAQAAPKEKANDELYLQSLAQITMGLLELLKKDS